MILDGNSKVGQGKVYQTELEMKLTKELETLKIQLSVRDYFNRELLNIIRHHCEESTHPHNIKLERQVDELLTKPFEEIT